MILNSLFLYVQFLFLFSLIFSNFVMCFCYFLVLVFFLLNITNQVIAVSCGTMMCFLFPVICFLFYFKGNGGSLSVGERLKKFLPTTSEEKITADSNETLHMLLDLVSIYIIYSIYSLTLHFEFTTF